MKRLKNKQNDSQMLIVKSKQRMKSPSILSTQLITLGIAEKGNHVSAQDCPRHKVSTKAITRKSTVLLYLHLKQFESFVEEVSVVLILFYKLYILITINGILGNDLSKGAKTIKSLE